MVQKLKVRFSKDNDVLLTNNEVPTKGALLFDVANKVLYICDEQTEYLYKNNQLDIHHEVVAASNKTGLTRAVFKEDIKEYLSKEKYKIHNLILSYDVYFVYADIGSHKVRFIKPTNWENKQNLEVQK